jgi:hypothetical protein
MVFQVSIGDILLLSNIAFQLGRAFTSGRKSAPSEFQEVQNQLYSLGAALDALKDLPSSSPQAQGDPADGVSAIIQNCRGTLQHLESLVDKYLVIQDSPQTGPRRWRSEMVKNWRKIQWTTEGGTLNHLRHNLGVHIASLNLAVQVMNKCERLP